VHVQELLHLVDSLAVNSGIGHKGRQNKSGRFAKEPKLQGEPLLFFFCTDSEKSVP
jgi:hypothetical protein